ncbi:MAG: asparagine synthase (glutamine-hydrolyzing) [Myxococcales bacterium]|nr:MAG: asparagine synthase (glutamine-hydrolyzing) [Myxococcales bacterium]
MCGIAGWVDYERDLREQKETARAMTQTMRNRGPDAEGLWLDERAALGHRRLAVIDVAKGKQPMIARREDQPAFVLVYTGEVYNFRELRRELATLGHRFDTESDTEVVLRAWEQWGRSAPPRLNGMFAFAVWDTREQQLVLVRDRLGVKPLYYYQTPTGVLFGSEPKAILANPLASAELDEDGMRELLAFNKTPGEGVFRGMREVRPGHVVTIRAGQVSEHAYWKLESRPHTDSLETTVRTIRELLEDIVTRQLVSDVPLCSLLSGGLDSSTITALAQRALTAQGRGPVRSFSVDFVGNERDFKPDEVRGTADAPFVAEVAEYVKSEHKNIVLSAQQLMDPDARRRVMVARDFPGVGDIDTSMFLLFRAIREYSTVALSGESADEVFGGYAWLHNPQVVETPTFPWVAMVFLRSGGKMQPLPMAPDLAAKLDLQGYLQSRYTEALAEVPLLEGEVGQEKRMRELCYLNLTRWLQMLLDRKDRMSMASSLEVRVPFCDHRLVEYVFNTPWSMKTFDGREKSLLRAAAGDLLPRSVLERRKSPYPATQDPEYERVLRARVTQVLDDRSSPVLALLDESRVRGLLQLTQGPANQFARIGFEHLLTLNAWLQEYKVRLVT